MRELKRYLLYTKFTNRSGVPAQGDIGFAGDYDTIPEADAAGSVLLVNYTWYRIHDMNNGTLVKEVNRMLQSQEFFNQQFFNLDYFSQLGG